MASRQSTRLAKQRVTEPPGCSQPDLPQVAQKKKKTNAERCREYKEKLKDSDRYEQYLENQRNRSKQYRENLSNEHKIRQAELSKLRMREMRKRKKEEQGLTTRRSQEHLRAKWRAEYEQRKTKMTPETKAAVNARRRRQYAARKAEKAQHSSSIQQSKQERIQPTPPTRDGTDAQEDFTVRGSSRRDDSYSSNKEEKSSVGKKRHATKPKQVCAGSLHVQPQKLKRVH